MIPNGAAASRPFLPTKDFETSRAFYEALGFTLIESFGPPFARVQRGDLTVWLSGPASSAARKLTDGSVPKPGGWNRFVIETDDIEGTMNAAPSPCTVRAAIRISGLGASAGDSARAEHECP